MELKEFITKTIKDINDGIQDGEEYMKSTNDLSEIYKGYTKVNFDIAVSASDSKSSNVGGGIKVASIFSVGGEQGGNEETKNISRIQFDVLIGIKERS